MNKTDVLAVKNDYSNEGSSIRLKLARVLATYDPKHGGRISEALCQASMTRKLFTRLSLIDALWVWAGHADIETLVALWLAGAQDMGVINYQIHEERKTTFKHGSELRWMSVSTRYWLAWLDLDELLNEIPF